MGKEIGKKSYDYRWYDFIPVIGGFTLYFRTLRSDIRGEINGLKENINSLINMTSITVYQVVSMDLIVNLIYGDSSLERIIKNL